ncbi:glutamate--cysteine ligase [Saccharopolyspora erythraea]|uniref:carboxylate-amine ligase n=1 Tax=Saccharopolyspora erythraea TaxID=1836 RepID=UPI001BA49F38|nr:glutamate--cysteine ligase [Saccharopolyspora erythraea]QUH02458.1 glutamate--cysteine ligase [Saccharopolyspora erythraea]
MGLQEHPAAPTTQHPPVQGGVTIGAEEEFLLVDAASGQLAPHAEAVLEEAANGPLGAPDALLHAEMLNTQLEAATGCCRTLEELRSHLVAARTSLARAASTVGARVLSSGTPVLAVEGTGTSRGQRFADIAERYRAVASDYHVCGCHVHVGVPDRDTAVAVVNHLRPWLPTLLAISANSPFHLGHDTGHASWRGVQQRLYPGSGVPPHFPSRDAYDREVARLVDCGALVDDRMSFWLARPSPHLPTVELRVADALITAEETVLQAGLSRALVRAALDDLAAGREADEVSDQVAAAAVWTASRYGLRGPAVDPVPARRVPAPEMVERLLRRVAPALEETGDSALVREALAHVTGVGTGAERQRAAAAAGGPREVVAMLAAATAPGRTDRLRT